MSDSKSLLEQKKEQYLLLKRKREIQDMLPHLYSFKFYPWSRLFFDSANPIANLLCAANQISKSSTQIRKCIHWATEPKLWPKLWRTRPMQFWYLYPSKEVATNEFNKKWIPEFMPKDEMKTHGQYGWVHKNKQGFVHEILFNTGVSVFFKTYSQDVHTLQSGTVHAMFCDEELPIELFDELYLRLAASEGYYHQVFTATKGQEFWRRAIERIGKKDEVLKGALKIQVSMYDCLKYEDGSPTPWNEKKIERIKSACKSQAEIDKRVYGKFVLDSGRKYPNFDRYQNLTPAAKIDKRWFIYTGVDIGSGGKTGHPAAIAFVAVRPDYKKGIVFRGWRGNNKEVTTASDILQKYRVLRGRLQPILQLYDWAAADFKEYASRLGETFIPAEKSHEIGEDFLNILFKNKMLFIMDLEELNPLCIEFESLLKETKKKQAKDDYIDAVRYAVTKIPWDWSAIEEDIAKEIMPREKPKSEIAKRREFVFGTDYIREETERVEDLIGEYNDLMYN